jgi:CII-binding regulator of phage lambda lysogenization HflD
MIPQRAINVELATEETIETSRTYKITGNRIQGYTDGLDALKQAIYKVLNTERYEYPIYSFNYGIDLESLVGKDRTYVQIELKRRISECLLQDERITGVDNFRFEGSGDVLKCTFDVHSIFGNLAISREVSI